MLPMAFAITWVGYTYVLYGYCLLKGYNVTLRQLLKQQWPPDTIDASDAAGPKQGFIRTIPGK